MSIDQPPINIRQHPSPFEANQAPLSNIEPSSEQHFTDTFSRPG